MNEQQLKERLNEAKTYLLKVEALQNAKDQVYRDLKELRQNILNAGFNCQDQLDYAHVGVHDEIVSLRCQLCEFRGE